MNGYGVMYVVLAVAYNILNVPSVIEQAPACIVSYRIVSYLSIMITRHKCMYVCIYPASTEMRSFWFRILSTDWQGGGGFIPCV